MQTLWFILVAAMIAVYVILDGFDLGAGIVHPTVARSNVERRAVLRAIGPVWDGNEVWLIAAGGTMFFTFPVLYASAFSGFYLPLIMVLWLLVGRGVAIELRSHFPNAVWTSLWDGVFWLASGLLAFFFGVAVGNVVRGVPLDAHHTFFLALWTNFSPSGPNPGVLDWYTILVGLLTFSALAMHGANYLVQKTTGPVYERARRLFVRFWLATVVLTVLATIATFALQPTMGAGFRARPWAWIFPLIAVGGLVATMYFHRQGRDLHALFSSGAYLAGMIFSAAAGLYPNVLPAVNPAYSLTVSNASASQYAQAVGLVWWVIGIALAAVYFVFIYRLFWGKVNITEKTGY